MRVQGLLDVVRRFGVKPWVLVLAVGGLLAMSPGVAMAISNGSGMGELDCNGNSPIQRPLRLSMNCTDIRGFAGVSNANTWDGRFYDNGEYIGHDEPDMTFLSKKSGSGNDVTWTERVPYDPSAMPTANDPGNDVNHWFELSPAPWFSMAMCDSNSYPETPCSPESDSNAPTANCVGVTPCTTGNIGGGSAFMEMQLYPPGEPPFVDSISCDDTHWCAALTIDSLECTYGFASCNTNCEEPVNFAFIQRDGVPTGPVAPQDQNLSTETQNSETLLMNPGDLISVHMYDAAVPGESGQKAFKVVIRDLTTHQTGWMQASEVNGFGDTLMSNCQGQPLNFQPEYNTAQRYNIVPWAALQTNISTEYETGHWESCTSLGEPQSYTFNNGVVTDPFDGTVIDNTMYNECFGPYEAAGPPDSTTPETGDAACYQRGDTHAALNSAPDEATGCEDNYYQNGDLDFDGNPYYPDWPVDPVNATRTFPGSFVEALPVTSGRGQYQQFFIQTDLALSESTCAGSDYATGSSTTAGCTVPPPGPGDFYPYWSRTTGTGNDLGSSSDRGGGGGSCAIEFGNVHRGVDDFGGDAQYGTDQTPTYGYPEFIGPTMQNSCYG